MHPLLQACAIVAGDVAVVGPFYAWAIITAPHGYEDANGFHRVGTELRNLRNHVDGSDTVS